jgi:hypothetical protein
MPHAVSMLGSTEVSSSVMWHIYRLCERCGKADGYHILLVQLEVQNTAHFSVSNRQMDNRNRALEIPA